MRSAWIGALGLVAVGAGAHAPAADDIETLAKAIYQQAVSSPPADSAVDDHMAAIQADGSFKNVDYADGGTANWQAQKHLNKMNDLLIAWATPGGKYHRDERVKGAALAAYTYWVSQDLQNTNWFFNLIATPDKMTSAMLVMQQNGILPKENFAKALTVTGRALKGQGGASQGANLASQAKITVVEGVVRYRAATTAAEREAAVKLIQKSYAYIGSTLGIVTDLEDDGIRVDMSFQQHQQTLYDAGYGASLLGNVATSANWAVGTGCGLSTKDMQRMVDYLLDGGPQWMVRGTTWDPVSTGRYWSRPRITDAAAMLLKPVRTAMALAGGYREEELALLEKRLADATAKQAASAELGLTGNRQFWISDYMVHHRPGWMMSVKTVSTRSNTPETINGENVKAGYGTAGVNLVMRSGREYDNIYPVWDWYRLPGTTSERPVGGNEYNLKPDHHYGKTALVGGVSDGKVGAGFYQMEEYGIAANKGYFFFDRGQVAMGNGIRQATANSPGGVVGTNVNQTLLKGDVLYSTGVGERTVLPAGKVVSPTGLRWVWHDSVAYLFLTPADHARISTMEQKGDWRSINVTGSKEVVKTGVFSLDLEHGTMPKVGSYVYAIAPGISAEEVEGYLAGKPFEVIRNDGLAQAVHANGVTAVHFLGAGEVQLSEGVVLRLMTVDQGASVLWSRVGDKVAISVANIDGGLSRFCFRCRTS